MPSPAIWRLAALAFVALFSVIAAFQTSLVVDGRRYFWLYDEPMVCLRYARNLAEGQGLVWNPVERVELYASLLWTLILSGVQLSGLGEAKAPLAVQMLNGLLACGVVLLAERLLRFFERQPGLGLPLLWLALVPCFDLLFWSVGGFETTLLTVVFLLVAARLLEEAAAGEPRPGTYVLLGLLPLIRSDAYHAWAGLALLAIGMSPERARTLRLLGVSLILPTLHLAFRHAYYGHWSPEIGRLKVVILPEGIALGLRYVGRFARSYVVALLLGALGALRARDRRRWLLLAGLVTGAAHLLLWGGEALPGSPYLAHLVPVMLVLAVVGVLETARRTRETAGVLAVALAVPVALQARVFGPARLAPSEGAGMVTGVMIDRFAGPDATVGVFAPGSVGYFSRRRMIDLLARPSPEDALASRPDVVVVHLPHEAVVAYSEGRGERDNLRPVLESRTFREQYLPNPLGILDRTTVYFRASSPERERRPLWKVPQVSR